MKYENIVFMQGEESEEVLNLLEEEGEEAAFNHLVQWDYGDQPEEGADHFPWGKYDFIYKKNNKDGTYYIMSYRPIFQTIGLRKVLED